MKRKHARPLAIGAAVMLVLGWLSGLFERELGGADVPLLGIPAEDISSIRMAWPQDSLTIHLARDSTWQFVAPNADPADQRAVAALLRDLADLELRQALTFDEALYPSYGLEDSVATSLILTWNGIDRLFYFGHPDPEGRGQYIRFGQDPRMYTTDARLILPASLPYWRTKTVVDIAPDSVAQVTLTRPEQTYEIQGPAPWQMMRQGKALPVNAEAVAFWMLRFHPLQADSLVQKVAPEAVQARASHSVRLTSSQGASTTLWFAVEGTGMLVATNEAVYWLAVPERLLRLVPEPRDLL